MQYINLKFVNILWMLFTVLACIFTCIAIYIGVCINTYEPHKGNEKDNEAEFRRGPCPMQAKCTQVLSSEVMFEVLHFYKISWIC